MCKDQHNTPENPAVFYSWQSDRPGCISRKFIEDALEEAIKMINKKDLSEIQMVKDEEDGTPNKSIYPMSRIEADYLQSGMQILSNRVLRNIELADVFLGDVTSVCSYEKSNGDLKRMCNANVMFEMGYAVSVHGREGVLGVLNTRYGIPEDLPSDFQGSDWPVRYELNEYHDGLERGKALADLASDIYSKIRDVFINRSEKAKRISDTLNQKELHLLREGFKLNNKGRLENDDIQLSSLSELIDGTRSEEDLIACIITQSLISKGVLWTRHQMCQNSKTYMYSYRLTSLGKSIKRILHKDDSEKSE